MTIADDTVKALVALGWKPPAAAPAPTPAPTGLSVRVKGSKLIDSAGNVLQLRGVNYSGFEFVAIQGWSPSDPSGAQAGQPKGLIYMTTSIASRTDA